MMNPETYADYDFDYRPKEQSMITNTFAQILFSLRLGNEVVTVDEQGRESSPREKWLENILNFVDDSFLEGSFYRVTLTLYIPEKFTPQDIILSVFETENASVHLRFGTRTTSGAHADVLIECQDKSEDERLTFQTPNMSGTMGFNIEERIVIQPI